MKYFVRNFVHQPRPWETSKLRSVFLLILTNCEYSDLYNIRCRTALDHQTGWLGEQWHWLGGKIHKCFHRHKPKSKRKQRKPAGGMKHNVKRKTPIFLGSPSLASIIHLWQNPCRSWGGEKTRKYLLCVCQCFTIQHCSTTTDTVMGCIIYVLPSPAPRKTNAPWAIRIFKL